MNTLGRCVESTLRIQGKVPDCKIRQQGNPVRTLSKAGAAPATVSGKRLPNQATRICGEGGQSALIREPGDRPCET